MDMTGMVDKQHETTVAIATSGGMYDELLLEWFTQTQGMDTESTSVIVALLSDEQRLELLNNADFVAMINAKTEAIKSETETWRWGEMPGDTILNEWTAQVKWATGEGPGKSW